MRSATAMLGRTTARLAAALALLALIVGVPSFLAFAIGWPLPTTVPTGWDGWKQLLSAPIPDIAILRLLAVACWLLWAAFTRALWIEAHDAWRGVHTPHRLPGVHPLRALASFLIVTIAAGSIATGAAARPTAATAAPPPALVVVTAPATPIAATVPAAQPSPTLDRTPVHAAPLLPAGPAILRIHGCNHLHTVVRGESLWAIAETCLGDGLRWPEIWQLNEGKFWPEVSGYKRLDDPDLIYPRWTLELPAGAVAPPDAPQVEPADPPPTSPATSPTDAPTTPATTGPATATPAAGAPAPTTTPVPAAVPPITATPAPTTSMAAAPSPSPSPTTAAPSPVPSTPAPPVVDDEHGVTLPDGSWVSWALAGAVVAAAAMVWLQRRRRYIPVSGEEFPDLPMPVRQLDRAVRRNPDLPTPRTEVEKAATVPPQPALPLGGVGLVGTGAAAAARAAVVAMLASGGPHNPHDRAEIVIAAATLATLIGPDAVNLAEWPRLHIADDADAALLHLETEIVRRGRILSYHDTPTLAALREQVPDEEALPPVLLVCEAPPATSPVARLEVTAGLGARLNISTLLLGAWVHGPTLDVAADGRTRLVGDRTGEHPLPDRIAVLEPDSAAQILLTVREAHTGKRPPAQTAAANESPATLTSSAPVEADRVGQVAGGPPTAPGPPPPQSAGERSPAADRDAATPVKVRLRVLGNPGIDDVTAPGRPLRAKALELAVFLACHPDGAATRDIGEHLAPDYTLSKADQQVHTNASNLRHVFARAAGPREDGYILKMPGESTAPYRLDPDTVEVDLWQLRDLLRFATLASGERRRELLAAACGLYTGPLAEGCDYEWITPYRETARRWGTEAHLLYAETLLDTDPQTAADTLDQAIRLDPHNEQLYVRAMQARHALRDSDGLRIVMRALTKALADLDAEPAEETIANYQRLRASLDQR